MATATLPTSVQPAIADPLLRLRRGIRLYVLIEGLAWLAIIVCLWFWGALLLDYGMFRLFGFDYLREGSGALRGLLRGVILTTLGLGLVGVVGYLIVYRLLAAFHQPDLALVLERRFPRVLGDRLVTAVELSNPDQARRYGYSWTMVENTSRQAANRAERLELREVFNWKRIGAALVVAAILILSVAITSLLAADVAGCWADRTLLLRDVYWPRSVMLDLPGFRDTDARAVPYGAEFHLPVRAWKWVLAASDHPEGWRPATWAELWSSDAWELRDLPAPKAPLPASWQSLTVDEVELRVIRAGEDSAEGHALLAELGSPETRLQLATLLGELDRRSDLSAIGRRRSFRRLEVPEEVTVEFEQVLTEEERLRNKPKIGMPRVRREPGSNDYAYDFKRIDRPIRFRVLGGDAFTPWKRIDVKPVPALKKLTRWLEEPGYRHDSNEPVQTGPLAVSLEGEESRFDAPAGTRLRLEAESYKPLAWVRVSRQDVDVLLLQTRLAAQALAASIPPTDAAFGLAAAILHAHERDSQLPVLSSLTHQPGSPEFKLLLRELGSEDLRLRIDFEDTDGILGARRLVVGPIGDKEPEFVHAGFEIVRREMITDQAVIPFSGRVRDDFGLMDLWYEVSFIRMDGTLVRKERVPLRRFNPLRFPVAKDEPRFDRLDQVRPGRLLALRQGDHSLGDRWLAALGLASAPVLGGLGLVHAPLLEPVRDHVFEFPIRPGHLPPLALEDEFLDTLPLRQDSAAAGPGRPEPLRPPYRLVIRLVGKDNRVLYDAAGKPHPAGQEGRSAEAFDFLVVSEQDVLIESGKREEDIRERCESIIENLRRARLTLRKVRDEYDALLADDDFRRAAADGQDVSKVVRESRETLDREVVREFRQIYRELVLNRCQAPVLERMDQKICRPLEVILLPGQHFERAEDALDTLAAGIKEEKAKLSRPLLAAAAGRLDQLITRLEEILAEMQKLIEFNQALEVLRDIIKKEAELIERMKQKEREQRKKELRDLK